MASFRLVVLLLLGGGLFLLFSSCFLFPFSYFKNRLEAVMIMVIHSWVAMVKSISPPPSATAECISLMRCLQPVCPGAAAAQQQQQQQQRCVNQRETKGGKKARWLFLHCMGFNFVVAFRLLGLKTKGCGLSQ